MRFEPLSEMEVLNLIQPGDYDFLVKKAEDTVSKSGQPMIKLTLSIWDDRNNERTVFDYILPAMMYKLRHFADSIGIMDLYEAGGYSANDCANKSGRCKVIIDMKEESTYPPCNVIKDYIKRIPGQVDKAVAAPAEGSAHGFINDDVPF